MVQNENSKIISDDLQELCDEFRDNNQIPMEKFDLYGVKRGLRNPDGTGVLAGLTQISNVHGYLIDDSVRVPDKGILTYRGIDIADIVEGCRKADRFGYEEVVWLLLFGELPTAPQLEKLRKVLSYYRELPENFTEDMIFKAPSRNIMNKMARSVLALYSYDDNPDDISLENNMRQSLQLIARLPIIMTCAYQVKRRKFDKKSMFFHPVDPSQSIAESVLDAIRPDRKFTHDEAHLLDLCMMLHAEHSGGNNSTFSVRVLSSTGTDIYSAIAAGIGSLKGPKHGGANHRVMMMMNDLMQHVDDWGSEKQVHDYLVKIVNKEVGDHSGLIYGMGHAVYTLSDPRAVILKREAEKLAPRHKGMKEKFELFELVEKLAPKVFEEVHGDSKVISANVDFYSGLVYEMLNIPSELYTPLFAVSRMAGWCAHRIEEIETAKRIMRPAYRSLSKPRPYIPLEER
ncbi:MAG TPA: citrate synthase [Ruminococcaceae bacterium]|jgi:citrate synthase|nr:citrate synthase [Oscillospiraceae bacterium]HCC02606.1 citrate synthase [Oscillospiraceae bacterium]HCM24647.1 citrate synthase [Oscillospiraceae bacterium]